MSRHILLDSTPLGLITKPKRDAGVIAITQWTRSCLAAGHRVYVPEVIDYEVRRELIRAGRLSGVRELDAATARFRYLPINTEAMLLAADLWAKSRSRVSQPEAHSSSIST